MKNKTVGMQLAELVAIELEKERFLSYVHRDYCGHGLIKQGGKYGIYIVHDGIFDPNFIICSFSSRDQFIQYLSRQSDYSFSGADSSEHELHTLKSFELNNQRLSIARLTQFVEEQTKAQSIEYRS